MITAKEARALEKADKVFSEDEKEIIERELNRLRNSFMFKLKSAIQLDEKIVNLKSHHFGLRKIALDRFIKELRKNGYRVRYDDDIKLLTVKWSWL